MQKEILQKEINDLIDTREEFYDFLDANIPKDKSGFTYDFSNNPKIDAKKVYELFHKLDYQARRIRGRLIKQCDLKG